MRLMLEDNHHRSSPAEAPVAGAWLVVVSFLEQTDTTFWYLATDLANTFFSSLSNRIIRTSIEQTAVN